LVVVVLVVAVSVVAGAAVLFVVVSVVAGVVVVSWAKAVTGATARVSTRRVFLVSVFIGRSSSA